MRRDWCMASKDMPAWSEEKGAPRVAPNYRIVPIVDVPAPAVLEAQRLGVGWCTGKRCSEVPTSLMFMDIVRGGRVLTRTQRFCPAHAALVRCPSGGGGARAHDPVVGCAPPRPADAVLERCGAASAPRALLGCAGNTWFAVAPVSHTTPRAGCIDESEVIGYINRLIRSEIRIKGDVSDVGL